MGALFLLRLPADPPRRVGRSLANQRSIAEPGASRKKIEPTDRPLGGDAALSARPSVGRARHCDVEQNAGATRQAATPTPGPHRDVAKRRLADHTTQKGGG